MPVYAYACASCGHAFDVRQSFDDAALSVCERCGGALRKQYGTIGVSFNGPGFYRNDSRATTGSPASSGSKSESKGESKSESKAAKGESKAPAKSESKAPAASSSGSGSSS